MADSREVSRLAGKTNEPTRRVRLTAQGAVGLLRARSLFEAMVEEYGLAMEAWPSLAQAASGLVEVFVTNGQWAPALKLYQQIKMFGRSRQVLGWRALTGSRLVAHLVGDHQIGEAERVYRTTRVLGQSGSVALDRSKAAFYLLTAAIQAGNTAKAKSYHDQIMAIAQPILLRGRATLSLVPALGQSGGLGQLTKPDSGEFNPPRLSLVGSQSPAGFQDLDVDRREELAQTVAKATINLISGYVFDGRADEAAEVYWAFAAMDLDAREFLARGACDLVYAYARAGRWDLARERYAFLAGLEDDVNDFRAKAAANLVVLYSESRMWPEAETLLRELAGLAPQERAEEEKTRAVAALMLGYLDQRRWDEALSLYRRLSHLGVGLSLASQAEAAINLLLGLAQAGRMGLALLVFEHFSQYQALPDHEVDLASAALGLVDGYARLGFKEEALKLHHFLMELKGPEEIILAQARSHFALITALALETRLDEAKELFQKMGTLPATLAVEAEKSKAMVNLISCLGTAGRLTEARELFEEFNNLQPSDTVIDNHGLAAFNLLCDYVRRLLVLEGLELLDFIERLRPSPLLAALQVEATVELIQAAMDLGRLRLAESLFQKITTGLGPQDYLEERIRAASFIINVVSNSVLARKKRLSSPDDLTTPQKLDLAREVFLTMEGLVTDHEGLEEWASSLVNLVTALESVGQVAEAQKVYQSLLRLGQSASAAVLGEWSKAAFNRITFRAEAGKLEEAVALLAEMEEFGRSGSARPRLAQAMVNVVSALGQAGWLEVAQAIYERSKELGRQGQMPVYRAKTLYNLILGYFKTGRLTDAAELFTRFEPGPELKTISPQLVEAAMELILALAAVGARQEARGVHETMKKILAEAGLPSDWASFELMVKEPPTKGGSEKLALITAGRLRQTVKNLQERRKSREVRELASPDPPTSGSDEIEGRANLKPWTFGHYRWNRR
ncbi:MAG: hypothetical protein LBT86_10565 [Deltaproteobacteria bacterium]|nr:hypothetical protein [Deltaproteobacteria bacterium]